MQVKRRGVKVVSCTFRERTSRRRPFSGLAEIPNLIDEHDIQDLAGPLSAPTAWGLTARVPSFRRLLAELHLDVVESSDQAIWLGTTLRESRVLCCELSPASICSRSSSLEAARYWNREVDLMLRVSLAFYRLIAMPVVLSSKHFAIVRIYSNIIEIGLSS